MTTVVHCKKAPYDVYIGRPSKWGNPFQIGPDGNRLQVIAKYKEWIMTQPQLLADLIELKDKVLGCWCKPHDCHGDVLAELADTQEPPPYSGEDYMRAKGMNLDLDDWNDYQTFYGLGEREEVE